MEGQCNAFLSKILPGRSFTILICLYPSPECSLGLGNGSLLQGVHVTWEQGQWRPFYKESLPLGILPFSLSVKDAFNSWYIDIINKTDSWHKSLAPTNGDDLWSKA